ncbi:hypoxanthine phosphoribosyltransferase [Magnetospira sp. QH-2]|uniref:hypoxanthine phosphoribosyltransferase n=1 Tax=Magnetospira sp. (strain QH-2) TaxID=1288970 RepID=UPI0003E80F99|nr:hypoxanthine phosphoribosyltransferase [Magnetospira sp. QH-2]CCQ73535.1 Hypoxanthine phosphoribosyltransferase [Magnetospira sp. QH-2]
MDDMEILIGAGEIARRIDEMAGEIADRWPKDEDVLAVVLMKGAFVFAADLVRALHTQGLSVRMDFLSIGSYGTGTESGKCVTLRCPLIEKMQGKTVLVIDEILDSGRSLTFAVDHLATEAGAKTVFSCVLLDKPERRVVEISGDFVGFEIPDKFIVGYGADHAERYRELPYIAVLDPG